MKKISTIASVLLLSVILLASCTKRDYYDDSYWLSRERGVVVYSDPYCPYYVVETRNGYTVIYDQTGRTPYEGTVIYGDLSIKGSRDLYDYSDGVIIRGNVRQYWLSYYEAQIAIDDFCQ